MNESVKQNILDNPLSCSFVIFFSFRELLKMKDWSKIHWFSLTHNFSAIDIFNKLFSLARFPLIISLTSFPKPPLSYAWAVSGQNKIGWEFTLLALIQPTVIKQQAVNNNWLWKLQLAVILLSQQKSNLDRIERD